MKSGKGFKALKICLPRLSLHARKKETLTLLFSTAMEMNSSASDDSSSSASEDLTSARLPRSSARKRSTPATKDPRSLKKPKSASRLWSEDDEIALLKGMLDYRQDKGADASANYYDFHDFIKGALCLDAGTRQVSDKIRKLKRRYENILLKKKDFGPHERTVFDLSTRIWGVKGDASNFKTRTASRAKVKAKAKAKAKAEVGPGAGAEAEAGAAPEGNSWQFIGESCIAMGLDATTVKIGLRLCNRDKKVEFEEKWKHLYLEETNLFLKKLDLTIQESKMIIEALKAGGK